MATALPVRTLGGLQVSAIGFGAMVLSPGVYGEVDDERGRAAIRHALDAGATMVDTSDAYGADGHNERLVGAAIRDRRDEVVVATKFGLAIPDDTARHEFPVALGFGSLAVNAEPQLIRGYAEASLRRLGIDVIDLHYLHWPDPQVPIEDTVQAMGSLVEDGLVRHLGLSNIDADQLRRAHAIHPISAVQAQWSLWAPVDRELRSAADELGVGVVAWSPLGAGMLTGTVTEVASDDFRQNVPGFSAENLVANNDRFAPVRAIADDLGITPSQLALAWLLGADEHVVPIPGSRTPEHITENLSAASLTLDKDSRRAVEDAVSALVDAGGARVRVAGD